MPKKSLKKSITRSSVCLLIILLILIPSLAGCQPKLTAKETFDRIYVASQAKQSIHYKIEGKMSSVAMFPSKEDMDEFPAYTTLSNMLKDATFKMDGYFEKTDKLGLMQLAYDVNLDGMSMHFDLFYDDNQLMIKYPLLSQFLVLSADQAIDAINEKTGFDMTYQSLTSDYQLLMDHWYPEYLESYLATVGDEDVELIDEYEFIVDGKKVTSRALRLKYSPELSERSMTALMASLASNQKVYEIVEKYDKKDEIASFENYQVNLRHFFSKMNLRPEGVTMDYVMGYDKAFNITHLDITMDVATEDPSFGKLGMTMSIDGEMTYEKEAIDFPELTESNQMDLLETLAPVLDQIGNVNSGVVVNQGGSDQEGADPVLLAHLRDVNTLSRAIATNPDLTAIDGLLSNYYKQHQQETARLYFTKADKSLVMFPPTTFPADYDPTATYEYETAVSFGMYAPEPYIDFDTNRRIQHIAKPIEVNGEILGVIVLDYYVGE